MASDTAPYPQPMVDAINRHYIESWQDGRFVLQYCRECKVFVFYPRPHCPTCWSNSLEWRDAAGRGRIVSFSLVYRPNHEAFFEEVPIVLAEVMLDEGVAMLARIDCNDGQAVASGRPVELVPPEVRARYPLPTFRLRSTEART